MIVERRAHQPRTRPTGDLEADRQVLPCGIRHPEEACRSAPERPITECSHRTGRVGEVIGRGHEGIWEIPLRCSQRRHDVERRPVRPQRLESFPMTQAPELGMNRRPVDQPHGSSGTHEHRQLGPRRTASLHRPERCRLTSVTPRWADDPQDREQTHVEGHRMTFGQRASDLRTIHGRTDIEHRNLAARLRQHRTLHRNKRTAGSAHLAVTASTNNTGSPSSPRRQTPAAGCSRTAEGVVRSLVSSASADRQLGTLPGQLGLDDDVHVRLQLQTHWSQEEASPTDHDQRFGAMCSINLDLVDVRCWRSVNAGARRPGTPIALPNVDGCRSALRGHDVGRRPAAVWLRWWTSRAKRTPSRGASRPPRRRTSFVDELARLQLGGRCRGAPAMGRSAARTEIFRRFDACWSCRVEAGNGASPRRADRRVGTRRGAPGRRPLSVDELAP